MIAGGGYTIGCPKSSRRPLHGSRASCGENVIEQVAQFVELAVYLGLGFLWALPFRRVFLGIGREDPDREG